MTRKITIYHTVGENKRIIESAAELWGDLQKDLNLHGISFVGMNAVVGETQHTLESSQALLPEEDFILFFMPKAVKSGYYEEEDMIDEEYGISWNEVDWSSEENQINDYQFRSRKDLAIARLRKAGGHIETVIEYISNETATKVSDPAVQDLSYMADQIRKNMGLFD